MFELRRWIDTVKVKSGLFSNQGNDDRLVYAPGTLIQYDPKLIARLEKDHAQLQALFHEMMEIAQANDFNKIRGRIISFLGLFNSHTLLEYTKLYIFMDYAFRDDEENRQLIRDFKREITVVSRDVRAYCARWAERDIGKFNVRDFIAQSGDIEKALTHRLAAEENSLYKIYESTSRRFVSRSVRH